MRKQSIGGFTLLELAIVLTVIGLLVGGILGGRSMMRNSVLANSLSDIKHYDTAVTQFRNRFRAWPGDMVTATNYFPTAPTGTCPTATGAGTCNGDGNGYIATGSSDNETFRLWQHLFYAGLISTNYTGVAPDPVGAPNYHVVGVNAPAGRIENSGFGARYMGTGLLEASTTANVLIFGTQHSSSYPIFSIMTALEARDMDTKIDDGKPGYGRMVQYPNSTRLSCVSGDTPDSIYLTDRASQTYNRSTTGCLVFYRMANQARY